MVCNSDLTFQFSASFRLYIKPGEIQHAADKKEAKVKKKSLKHCQIFKINNT